jgi:glutamine cyclotransferase
VVIGLVVIWLLPGCNSAAATPATAVPLSATPVVIASPPPVTPTVEVPISPLPTPTPTVGLDPAVPTYGYEIVNTYPHDPNAFTQGLVYFDGDLYESTGRYGQSNLRRVDLETGEVLQRIDLPAQYFGEGITLLNDRIYKLTWKEQRGFIYERETFELLQEFTYPTEGWGLTHDGQNLIMSDGSAYLYYLDPVRLAEVGRVEVRDGNLPIVRLNELEYIEGQVYANIWQTNWLVIIDPASGRVTGRILLDGLLAPEDMIQPVDVLNGIAYDPAYDRLFVTGKLWPKLFEIDLVPLQ